MPLEEDVESFCVWATKLGCPPDALPNEEALKSIFKSRQRELFCNLMKRVQPRQDVREVKENILIKKMEKHKNQVMPVCGRNFLPTEIQNYLKHKELGRYKCDVETSLAEHKREYHILAAAIKTKNIQNIDLTHKLDILESKVTILEYKLDALNKDVCREQQNKEQIIAKMPTKLNKKNASESAAHEAVQNALKELDHFYNLSNNNDNNQKVTQEAKDELWCKMRKFFSNIPNFLIFNTIIRLKEEQLQNIIALNRTHMEKSNTSSFNSNAQQKEPLNAFELNQMKIKADLLGMVAKYLSTRHEHAKLEEQFYNVFTTFVEELKNKVLIFNAEPEENVDFVISDYMVQYNLRNFYKSQNEFLAKQIELYKAELECGSKQLENHEVLLGSIKQVYNDINASINHVQHGLLQLGQIKDKILFSKNMLRHLMNDQQSNAVSTKSNFLNATLKVNSNISAISSGIGDSFNSSAASDNVFCSTKLDLDVTSNSLGNTAAVGRSFSTGAESAPSGGMEARFTLPLYSTELKTFADMALEYFSCVSKECAFYLAPNPFIVASRELLSSTVQLAPGILLTPFGTLQEVRNRIVWADLIAAQSNDLKLDLDFIVVDAHAFRHKIKQQRDYIAELLEKIDVTCINTNRLLQKTTKLYEFILENPMGQYIPAIKCFNNQTFSDYEAEYLMYYRMATVGASIK